jgi:enoyl-CoA hydratase
MSDDIDFCGNSLDEAVTIVHEMVRFPLSVIAVVNGPAVGLGCSLTSLSDIVLIEESAYLGGPHVSVGLVAADGGALAWPMLTSLLRAKEFLFTGDRISSDPAVQIGIVDPVMADGTSVAEALVLAARLAEQPAQALRGTKRAISKQLEQAVLMVLDYAVSAEAVSSGSAEHRAIVERMRDWMDRP